jgi:signal recognition particle subunit SRP72
MTSNTIIAAMPHAKESVNELFSKLNVGSGSSEREKTLKQLKDTLIAEPGNVEAQKLFISALVEVDRFHEAYRSIKVFGIDESYRKFPKEVAYVFYRSGHFKELMIHSADSRGIRHIVAQAQYQEEQLEEVERIYSSILKENEEVTGEFPDVDVNISAITAKAALNDLVVFSHDESFGESHDQLFNVALVHIGAGNYNSAVDYLRKAKLACQNSTLSAEDIASELIPIQVQAAYVSQLLGNTSEALDILETTGLSAIKDEQIRLVALNNFASLKELNNPNDVLKSVGFEQQREAIALKTVNHQKRILELNELLLYQLSGRDISKQFRKLRKHSPDIVGVEASGLYSQLQLEQLTEVEQVKVLKAYLKKHEDSIAASLLLVQLLSNSKNYELAASVLDKLTMCLNKQGHGEEYYPGLVAAHVSILKIQNRKARACEVISKAIDHWNNLSMSMSTPVFELSVSESDSLRKVAETFFKDLVKRSETPINIAGYVSAGPDTVSPELKAQLPDIDTLIGDVDSESLNSLGVNPLLSSHNEEYSHNFHSSKRRKTKSKLTKDFDPEKQPDPERWLPKRDRTTYKPKRKEKRNASKATQGTSQAVDVISGQSTVIQGKQKNKKKSKR